MMYSMLEIRPANLAQVVDYDGRMVEVASDVTNVAVQLREIDPNLKLLFAMDAKDPYWMVRHDVPKPDGSVEEQLVLTSMDLGSHIVERVRQITGEGYDFVGELERLDAEAKKREDQKFTDQRAPILEKLEHAVRKDLGIKRNF